MVNGYRTLTKEEYPKIIQKVLMRNPTRQLIRCVYIIFFITPSILQQDNGVMINTFIIKTRSDESGTTSKSLVKNHVHAWSFSLSTVPKPIGKICELPSCALAVKRQPEYFPFRCVPSMITTFLIYVNPLTLAPNARKRYLKRCDPSAASVVSMAMTEPGFAFDSFAKYVGRAR